jgi:hypothetical protein
MKAFVSIPPKYTPLVGKTTVDVFETVGIATIENCGLQKWS